MRAFSFSFIALFFSLYSLAQGDDAVSRIDINNFDKELKLEELFKPVKLQGEVWKVHVMVSDGIYCYVLFDKDRPAIKVYRLSDGKYMGGLASQGDGPGEFTAFNRSGFGIRKGQLIVQGRKYLRIYDIKEKDDELDFPLYKEVKVPGEIGVLNYGFLLSDDELAGAVMFSPKEFVTLKISPKQIGAQVTGDFGSYPDLYPEIPNTANHHLYQGNVSYSQDGKFLAKAYSTHPLIRVFNLVERSTMDIELIPENQQIAKVVPDKRGKSIANGIDMIGYQRLIKMSNELIISDYEEVVYEATAMTERGNVKRVSKTDRVLLVMTRKGELLAKLSPPEWLNDYTLTPDNKMIVFHPEMEDRFFIVDLSQFK